MPGSRLNAFAWCALALVLAGSMTLKVARYGLAAPVDRQAIAEARIIAFLAGQGFDRPTVLPLSSGGAIRELVFMAPGCEAPVRVVALKGDGAEAALVRKAWAPDDPVFLWQGRALAEPPGTVALAANVAGGLVTVFGDGRPGPMPVVAINAGTQEPCSAPPAAAWPR